MRDSGRVARECFLSRLVVGHCLAVLVVGAGCGKVKPVASRDSEPTNANKTLTATQEAPKDEEHRRGRTGRGAQAKRERGRARDLARVRKWNEKHLYMRLALDHLDLAEEQRTRLADLNWNHFVALEKLESDRPSMSAALMKMLESGAVDPKFFEAELKWLTANDAMLETQYKERMEILHKILDRTQRQKLVALVEAEQKKQYAAEDKKAADATASAHPFSCGAQGFRLLNRLVSKRDLIRTQRRALAEARDTLDRDGPTTKKVKELRQAVRIYDMAVRKSFARRSFELSKIARPRSPSAEPSAVTTCRQKAVEAFLKILTEADRKAAVERLKEREARRQGLDLDAEAPDAGITFRTRALQ